MSVLLRWHAAEDAGLARRFRRLGFRVMAAHGVEEPTIRLAGGLLVLVEDAGRGGEPARLEVASGTGGRVAGGSRARAVPSPPHPNGIDAIVGLGWATVDADRATTELGREESPSRPAADDLLGARARVAPATGGVALAFLEPATEGRLAATLARFGAGPAVAYVGAEDLDVARIRGRWEAAGERVTGPGRTPFGPGVLLLGPTWGPHLVAVSLPRVRADATIPS